VKPRRLAGWLSCIALIALCATSFARLLANPSALIVDGCTPSLDRANLAGPRAVGNDVVDYVLPQFVWIRRTLQQFGHVPLWDNRGFAGRPFCGNPQSGMFYPPLWAAWWFGSPAAPGWLTVAHLLWAGMGTYRLARFLGAGRWASTVAAAVYQASPYLLGHAFEGHYPHVWSASWYPWAFWSFANWRAGRMGAAVLLPVILAFAYLTGHPQEWLLLVLALITWSIFDVFGIMRHRGARGAAREALVRGCALALSLGLVAVEIAPQLAVRPWLLQNRLQAAGLTMPGRYDLSWLNGFELLSPTALGGPSDYLGDDNYWETLCSAGFLPLVLAATAAFYHLDRRRLRGWLLVVGLSVWFACGRNLGLYALLYFTIPGMNLFRVPGRSLFLAALGTAVLAGMGVDCLRRELAGLGAWRAYARRLAAVLFTVLMVLLFCHAQGRSPVFARAALAAARVLSDTRFWLCLLSLASLLAAGCLVENERSRRLAGMATGLVAFVELGWAGFSLIQVAPVEQFLKHDPAGAAINRLVSAGPHAVPARIKARDSFYTDLNAIASGLEKTNINDVFQLDHAARLYETLYRSTARPRPREAGLLMREAVADFEREVRQAVYDRLGVAYLISDRVEPDPGWPVVARGHLGSASFFVQRNGCPLPRAYVVPTATIADEPPPCILSLFRELDPRRSVVMDRDPLAAVDPDRRQPFTPAQWVSLDPDHPVLRVTTQAAGLLVVADTWMPGWTARVDAHMVPVLRGNIAQRVIPLVAPGAHTVVMSYRPPGLVLGAWVTAASILAWFLAVGWIVLTHQRRPEIIMPRRRPFSPRYRSAARANAAVFGRLVFPLEN